MCRIVGFWDFNYKKDYDLEKIITLMRDTLVHGGPDDAGNYVDDQNSLTLGHRRLSILDLSPLGHQPMEFENFVITYNGEVYNLKEIRKELEKEGYTFKSKSDTEVILKAFHRWGFDAVHKFRGMFAFAIWDKTKKELILCRDRVGIKPFYYYYKDGFFAFASELKAFHLHPKFEKNIDYTALTLYLQYGYIPAPYSIFQNTFKLKPGHFLVIDSSGHIEEFPYWKVEDYFLKGIEEKDRWLKRSEDDLVEELESILTESFKLRLVSDVPVGMFLSGGIDSSTVCALLIKEGIKLKTFTIGFFEKEYNEAPYAKRIAEHLGTDYTELYCTPKEAYEIIPRLPELYDEPFGDSSAIPTFLVSQLARKQVKVSLSADGGDEQFCGYTRYWLTSEKIAKLSKIPFKSFLLNILNLINPDIALKIYETFKPILPKYTNFRDKYIKLRQVLKSESIMDQYDLAMRYFLGEDLKEDLKDLNIRINKLKTLKDWLNLNELDNLSTLMLLDLKTYLPDDILVKVDRATMGVSLEGREPFLDHKILEWTSQLPVEFKYKNGQSKYILERYFTNTYLRK